MKELEEEWGKLSGGPAVPTRLLRSQQAQAATPQAVGGGGGGEEGGGGEVGGAVGGGGAEAIDPYDLLDPVDVLAQLPKDFYTRVVSWGEGGEG